MVSARWCWTSHRQCHTSLSLWRLQERVLRYLRKDFQAIYLTGLNPCDCFWWGCLKNRVLQKNPHTIPAMRMVIQRWKPFL
jgi:hypothetical protein